MIISIHAPREGSDYLQALPVRHAQGISIHAPREGSDSTTRTRSCRESNFNPRSPRGERPGRDGECLLALSISIHAPREGSDELSRREDAKFVKFQSTLPARGAT